MSDGMRDRKASTPADWPYSFTDLLLLTYTT
jgi:hypothetical protein